MTEVRATPDRRRALLSELSSAPWHLATVWMHEHGHENEASTRRIVRLRATDPDDYKHAVALLWPRKVLTFGPISVAKDQT